MADHNRNGGDHNDSVEDIALESPSSVDIRIPELDFDPQVVHDAGNAEDLRPGLANECQDDEDEEVACDREPEQCGSGALGGNEKENEEEKRLLRFVLHDQGFGRLDYIDSQEPTDFSQANALGFVDNFIVTGDVELSPGIGAGRGVRRILSPLSAAKGPRSLAESIHTRSSERKVRNFEWVDSEQHGGDGSAVVDCCQKEMSSVKDIPDMNCENNFSKPDDSMHGVPLEQELDNRSNPRDTFETFDVGFDTQVAAEAIEALSYAQPSPQMNSSGNVTENEYLVKRPFQRERASPNGEMNGIVSGKRSSARKRRTASWDHTNYQEFGCTDASKAKTGSEYLTKRSSTHSTSSTYKAARPVEQGKRECVGKSNVQENGSSCNSSTQIENTVLAEQQKHSKGGKLASSKAEPDNLEERIDGLNAENEILYGREQGPEGGANQSEEDKENQPNQQMRARLKASIEGSNLRLNTWSCLKRKRTQPRKGNHLSGAKKQNTSFTTIGAKEQLRTSSEKYPPNPFLLKELCRLGIRTEPILDFTWKDLRKRRNIAYVRILFSQHLDEDIIKKDKKIMARLSISIASSVMDATHFVADKFVRTRNMLEAIALGKPVVTHLWIESCGEASCLIDEKNYILRDAKKEKEIGFSLPVSLGRASQHPLLKGLKVLITPNIKPHREIITNLVKMVHGQSVESTDLSAEKIPDDILILSCKEDHPICLPFLQKGLSVYSSEFLLTGIVIQKLEYQRHRLFVDDNTTRNHHRRR